GFGLPTLAPPPLVQLVSASIAQFQLRTSIQLSRPFCTDSPSALSKNVSHAFTATSLSLRKRCPEILGYRLALSLPITTVGISPMFPPSLRRGVAALAPGHRRLMTAVSLA